MAHIPGGQQTSCAISKGLSHTVEVSNIVLTSSIWLWAKSGVSSISGTMDAAGASFARLRGGLLAAVCPVEASFTGALVLMTVKESNLNLH